MITSDKLPKVEVPPGTILVDSGSLYTAIKAVKQTEIHALPILNHVLVQLTDEGMRLTTTNLEKFRVATVCFWGNGTRWETCALMVHTLKVIQGFTAYGGKIEKTRKFYPVLDYLRVMAEYGEQLFMEFDSSVQLLTIRAGASKAVFKCLDAQEFPPVREELIV